MVSSLKGYLIESSLQKNPRWKGLCCTLSITNGIPTSREAMGEKTRKNKIQVTRYYWRSDPYPCAYICKAGHGSHVRGLHESTGASEGSSILAKLNQRANISGWQCWQLNAGMEWMLKEKKNWTKIVFYRTLLSSKKNWTLIYLFWKLWSVQQALF